MNFSKYIVVLLAASMVIPAIASCCRRGSCCRRRTTVVHRAGKVVIKPAPHGRVICHRGGCRRPGGCCR